jgi:hypothetical protein
LQPCRKTAKGLNRDRADRPPDAGLRRRSEPPANEKPQPVRHPPAPSNAACSVAAFWIRIASMTGI